jgi:hypothetical protein
VELIVQHGQPIIIESMKKQSVILLFVGLPFVVCANAQISKLPKVDSSPRRNIPADFKPSMDACRAGKGDISLANQFPAPKDQGPRGTCYMFGFTAGREAALNRHLGLVTSSKEKISLSEYAALIEFGTLQNDDRDLKLERYLKVRGKKGQDSEWQVYRRWLEGGTNSELIDVAKTEKSFILDTPISSYKKFVGDVDTNGNIVNSLDQMISQEALNCGGAYDVGGADSFLSCMSNKTAHLQTELANARESSDNLIRQKKLDLKIKPSELKYMNIMDSDGISRTSQDFLDAEGALKISIPRLKAFYEWSKKNKIPVDGAWTASASDKEHDRFVNSEQNQAAFKKFASWWNGQSSCIEDLKCFSDDPNRAAQLMVEYFGLLHEIVGNNRDVFPKDDHVTLDNFAAYVPKLAQRCDEESRGIQSIVLQSLCEGIPVVAGVDMQGAEEGDRWSGGLAGSFVPREAWGMHGRHSMVIEGLQIVEGKPYWVFRNSWERAVSVRMPVKRSCQFLTLLRVLGPNDPGYRSLGSQDAHTQQGH